MMISDKINRHDHGSYTEQTDLSSSVNVTGEEESKEIIVHKNLLEKNSTDVSKSERNIVNEIYRRTIPQTYQKILLWN